jgi:hypothetical protein
MPSPTPSLPASIREALHKYAIAVALYEASGSPLAEQDMDERKAALEAHILALVAREEQAADLIALSKCDAITESCISLAREFRAEYRRAYPDRHPTRGHDAT